MHFDQISEKKAQVFVDTEVKNSGTATQGGYSRNHIDQCIRKESGSNSSRVMLNVGESVTVKQKMQVQSASVEPGFSLFV